MCDLKPRRPMFQRGCLVMFEVDRLQRDYILVSDREYRRAAGQFFTPRWIASGMASWVISKNPKCIIDPAFGFGILLDECVRQGYSGKLVGYELDAEVIKRWRNTFDAVSSIDLKGLDFLECGDEPIDAAIVNPPYNRFQNRDLPDRVNLQLARVLGQTASGYTNQYALFLYLVISRLSLTGRAAFIVLSEFLATGYGVQVKKFLQQSGRLRHLIIFDTESRIFPEAATTACVLLFDSGICDALNIWHLAGQSDSDRFERVCNDKELTAPDASIARQNLEPAQNWQGLGRGSADLGGFVPLGTFGSVKRGIATGANEFFVLSPSKVKELKLGVTDLVPCIASASSVVGHVFSEDSWSVLKASDRPCYLFDGCSRPSAASQGYVLEGELQAIHERYLTRMRKPWFRLERRVAAPLLLAVFGRQGFRVILNRSKAVNLTAFHGFYPKPGYEHLVELIWLYFQTPTALATYAGQHRAYGDGLNKLEPGDWSKLYAPDWHQWDSLSLEQGLSLAAEVAKCRETGSDEPIGNAIEQMEDLIDKNRCMAQIAQHHGEQMSLV
ncbi:MAG: hypothetical protein CVU24_13630 [Betaproteobacteria bacterium HGW-Betaproteobacteria-18]|nr:MAG: hypothetical protein CVU24_13630 [Betaproteobacteria bacterium HGW-Betaproteobacteria-18]